MILDLAAKNPAYARHHEFVRGRPGAPSSLRRVLAAGLGRGARRVTRRRPGRRFEGIRASVLGVRTSLADAAQDDFWKLRKAGLPLLIGMLGDRKPVAFVEDTAVAPDRLPAFDARFRRSSTGTAPRAPCYGHADVGCLHIRPLITCKTTARWSTTCGRSPRRSPTWCWSSAARLSGEHGDGLARSLWNRKLFGPEVYEAFARSSAPSTRDEPAEPRQGRGRARPWRRTSASAPTTTPASRATALRLLGPGGLRPRGRDVHRRRRLPQDARAARCAPATWSPATRSTRTRGPRQRAAPGDVRRSLTARRPRPTRRLARGARPLPPVQGVQDRVPVQRRYGQAQGRVPAPATTRHGRPLGHWLMGHIHRLNPHGGTAIAPLANWTLRNAGLASWLMEKVAGIDRRRSLPTFASRPLPPLVPPAHRRRRAGERGRCSCSDDCFTTYNNPEVGRAAVRVLERAATGRAGRAWCAAAGR